MTDPIAQFSQWLEMAKKEKTIPEPTAMCLATAGKDARPSARMVLLKHFDTRGFVFFTNMESRKSHEIRDNAHAALCFYWGQITRQVRVEGTVERVGDAEADSYFSTRPRDSNIGCWASKQSEPLDDREMLVQAVHDYNKKFAGQDVPRPPFWSGWRVIPEAIEFWEQGEHRLHERELFVRHGHGWTVKKLYP